MPSRAARAQSRSQPCGSTAPGANGVNARRTGISALRLTSAAETAGASRSGPMPISESATHRVNVFMFISFLLVDPRLPPDRQASLPPHARALQALLLPLTQAKSYLRQLNPRQLSGPIPDILSGIASSQRDWPGPTACGRRNGHPRQAHGEAATVRVKRPNEESYRGRRKVCRRCGVRGLVGTSVTCYYGGQPSAGNYRREQT